MGNFWEVDGLFLKCVEERKMFRIKLMLRDIWKISGYIRVDIKDGCFVCD